MTLSLRAIVTIPTTRANLACFTSDKVSEHDVCPQGTRETWRRLGPLIRETANYYFIGYHVVGYRRAGQYPIFNFELISADTNNVLIILYMPNRRLFSIV